MKRQTIAELVMESKNNPERLGELISLFNPLINFYCKKLFFMEADDARQEIVLAIIEAVKRIQTYNNDGACVLYISNAVKYKFALLCKKNIAKEKIETIYDNSTTQDIPDKKYCYKDVEFNYDCFKTISSLSGRKKTILFYALDGYSDRQIADKLGISRQYVNRVKKEVAKGLLDLD